MFFSRDGYWHRSELLARLCGEQLPSLPIISTGSRMLLTYKTDERAKPHMGFTAKYEGKKKRKRAGNSNTGGIGMGEKYSFRCAGSSSS